MLLLLLLLMKLLFKILPINDSYNFFKKQFPNPFPQGNWHSQFNESDTKPDNFYVRSDKIRKADFMEQKGKFNYYVSEELRAHVLEMPYRGEEVSMVILLPPFEDGAVQQTVERYKYVFSMSFDTHWLFRKTFPLTIWYLCFCALFLSAVYFLDFCCFPATYIQK